MKKNIADIEKIETLAADVAREDELEVYDVRVETEGPRVVIRVYLEKEGGIRLGEVESFSRKFGARLDVEDPVNGPFVLEASSPGVNRRLTRSEHYRKVIGKRVRVSLVEAIDGVKSFAGMLESADDATLVLRRDGGAELSVPLRIVRKANLEATQEELFGKGKKKR